MGPVFEFIVILKIFCLILLLAYLSTRFIASRAASIYRCNYLKVIETLGVGGDKKLLLVKAGEKFLLLSMTSRSLNFISEVDIPNYTEDNKEEKAPYIKSIEFKKILEKLIKRDDKLDDITREAVEIKKRGSEYISNFGRNLAKIKNVYSFSGNGKTTEGDKDYDKKD